MRKTVIDYVSRYEVFQQCKHSYRAPAGLLQPLHILETVWEDVSMDFIEGLPTSGAMDTILMVVDRLSKYAHFVGLRYPFTPVTVAMAFIKEIVRLHSNPRSIVSNQNRVFMSLFWEELFKWQGTTPKRSIVCHAQTDG